MLPIACHFPVSAARGRALHEVERELRALFESLTAGAEAELKDTIHYLLFRVKDRYCLSAAWLAVEELGIERKAAGPCLCALEMVRCALATASEPALPKRQSFVDPALLQKAELCLIAMASSTILDPAYNPAMTVTDRMAVASLLNSTLSPLRAFSARRSPPRGMGSGASHARHPVLASDRDPSALEDEFGCAEFDATGTILETVLGATGSAGGGSRRIRRIFRRLGVLARLSSEFHPAQTGQRGGRQANDETLPPQAMDLLKTLEASILAESGEAGLAKSAATAIQPLSELLHAKLQ